MRIALVLTVVLAVAGCGKKQSPQAPTTEPAEPAPDDGMRNESTPDGEEDPRDMRTSDPEEGGE